MSSYYNDDALIRFFCDVKSLVIVLINTNVYHMGFVWFNSFNSIGILSTCRLGTNIKLVFKLKQICGSIPIWQSTFMT